MIEIKSDAALDAMREAGRVVANALAAARREAAVGVTLADLDEVAHEVLRADAMADASDCRLRVIGVTWNDEAYGPVWTMLSSPLGYPLRVSEPLMNEVVRLGTVRSSRASSRRAERERRMVK